MIGAVAACVAGLIVGMAAGHAVAIETGASPLMGRWSRSVPVAVTTSFVILLLTRRFGLSLALAVYAVFAVALVVLAAVDLECHRLPNRVLGPTAAVVGVLMVITAAVHVQWGSFGAAIGAGAVTGSAMWAVWWSRRPRGRPGTVRSRRSGLGFGDVRLAALVGAGAGWAGSPAEALLLAAIALGMACLSGVFVALGAVALSGVHTARTVRFPFGPCLALGGMWAVLWGPAVLRALVSP